MDYITPLSGEYLVAASLFFALIVGGIYWLACRAFFKGADARWEKRFTSTPLRNRLVLARQGRPSDKAFLHGLGIAGFALAAWLAIGIATL